MYEDAAEQDLMNCIECGCCAFVCPAQRPMVHFLRHGKIRGHGREDGIMNNNLLTVSTSPHILGRTTLRSMYLEMIIALAPALLTRVVLLRGPGPDHRGSWPWPRRRPPST